MKVSNFAEETKHCNACGETKPVSLFPKWRTKCRACKSKENSERLKERYKSDPVFTASVKERAAEWQRINAERSNEYHRRRHAKKIKQGDDAYIAKMSAAQRKYRESEKGKATIAARMRRYEENGQAKNWRDSRRLKPESRASEMLAGARSRALRMNIPCGITFDDVYPIVAAGRCVKTGIEFDLEHHTEHRTHPWAPSIDQINPAGGYTKDNIQIVCWAYNSARNRWGDDVLLTLARAIVDAHK